MAQWPLTYSSQKGQKDIIKQFHTIIKHFHTIRVFGFYLPVYHSSLRPSLLRVTTQIGTFFNTRSRKLESPRLIIRLASAQPSLRLRAPTTSSCRQITTTTIRLLILALCKHSITDETSGSIFSLLYPHHLRPRHPSLVILPP